MENRPGGRTLIAAEAVAHSEPDGDTLLLCLDDTFTIVPHLSKHAPLDPNKELVPINLVGTITMAMVVNPSLPVDSLPALVAYARANPSAVSYGSSGSGSLSHLAMEMLKAQAKIDMVHVPYRGLAPATTAVIAGEVQTAILGFGSSRSMIDSGRLRPIAIASPERVSALPNVPTTGEVGYGRVDATSRLTLAGPARMSSEMVERVNATVSGVLNNPDMRAQIAARDIVVTNMGPKPFAQEIEKLSRLNAEAVRDFGRHGGVSLARAARMCARKHEPGKGLDAVTRSRGAGDRLRTEYQRGHRLRSGRGRRQACLRGPAGGLRGGVCARAPQSRSGSSGPDV